MRVKANNTAPRARLLTLTDAAYYCGVSIPILKGICPVSPISLGEGERLKRYDVRDLDTWIDSKKGANDNQLTADALLADL